MMKEGPSDCKKGAPTWYWQGLPIKVYRECIGDHDVDDNTVVQVAGDGQRG